MSVRPMFLSKMTSENASGDASQGKFGQVKFRIFFNERVREARGTLCTPASSCIIVSDVSIVSITQLSIPTFVLTDQVSNHVYLPVVFCFKYGIALDMAVYAVKPPLGRSTATSIGKLAGRGIKLFRSLTWMYSANLWNGHLAAKL